MTTQMDGIYIYGPTGRIAKKVNDITEFYHTDHLGSTRLTTSETGAPVTEVQYKPFGEQINTTEERYTYNGKELDSTGLYYYGARYYDPTIGRFISRDPLQGDKVIPQTLNRYAYCLNNPLKYIDPTGTENLDPQQVVEEVFKYLQYIDPDDLSEIQNLLDSDKQLEALMRILELLGFEYTCKGDGTLSVKIGDESYTMKIDNDIGDWGQTNNDDNVRTISINFSSGKVGDIALTVLHEVCHAILGDPRGEGEAKAQHQSIYNVEYSYFTALRMAGVEFSSGDYLKGERNFIMHINHQVNYGYGSDPKKQIPLSEIMYRWVRGLTVQ